MGPKPSNASEVSSRTPSISARAVSSIPALAAARSIERRSAVPRGGSSSGWMASSTSDARRLRRGDDRRWRPARGPRRTGARRRVRGRRPGRWMIGGVEIAVEQPGEQGGGVALVDARRARTGGGWRARASSWGISQRAVVAMHADVGLAGDLLVERPHVAGDGVELALDAPGPLDDHHAVVGEPAPGPVDERRRRVPSPAGRCGR